MCGILGIINKKNSKVSSELLERLLNTIIHRGPDGYGIYIDNNVGIGHRRLAIIDRSNSGAQPMVSTCRKYVLSFNGEIYNHRELRDQLIRLGHIFCSKTDSEVVLNSWVEWGDKCVEKLMACLHFLYMRKKVVQYIC